MPCDTVREIAISEGAFEGRLDTLAAALGALGYVVTREALPGARTGLRFQHASGNSGTYALGKLAIEASGPGARESAERAGLAVRRAYTREGVAVAARRQGFRVEYDKQDASKMRLRAAGGA